MCDFATADALEGGGSRGSQAIVMPRERGTYGRAPAATDTLVAAVSMARPGSRVRLYLTPRS